jgi:Ca-activated chloride channel family protein
MIKDTIDEMAGDRVGLVLFAGEARQKIPLTSHYDDFIQALDDVGPDDLRRGGSRLGDAVTTAADAFLDQTSDHKAIVLLTDGEDQESEPVEAARTAHQEQGVRIFTIGLGDFRQGARIPVQTREQTGYLQHQGQQVWSKLNGEILAQVATATQGAYIPAGTKQVDMADVYHGYIASVEQKEFATAKIDRYEARYQWFLAPALLLLLAEIAITSWPPRAPGPSNDLTAGDGVPKAER